MTQAKKRHRVKHWDEHRFSQLEQRLNYLEEQISQVAHMAVWDSPNGEVTSIADLMERPKRD